MEGEEEERGQHIRMEKNRELRRNKKGNTKIRVLLRPNVHILLANNSKKLSLILKLETGFVVCSCALKHESERFQIIAMFRWLLSCPVIITDYAVGARA